MKPLFRTAVTELLGIDHPILGGGLMWLADANYVAALVNAGAMGFITAKTFPEPERFRAELRKAKSLCGSRPFGVNLYQSVHTEENAFLMGHLEILLEEGVRIVETSGLPPKAILPPLKEAGAIVIHKVASVRHAVSAAKLGVDAVSVVGAECGGHPGLEMVGTIVQAVRAAQRVDLPVIIGGGVGHGAQITGLLAMGADAVVIGTRFLVAEEIWAGRAIKERVLEAGEADTALVLSTMRNTYRVVNNADARAVADLEARGETDFERFRPLVAGLRQLEAYETDDPEKGLLSMGQAAGFADRIEPVGAIIARLMDEARAAHERLNGLMAPIGGKAR